MEKNGSSHLDFILSFTIFILFVVFMYSIIQPAIETPQGKESLLKLLRFDLLDDYHVEDLTTMTITLTGTRSQDCVKINGGNAKDILELAAQTDNLKIKDESANIVSYKYQGAQLLIGIAETYVGILKVYYGTDVDRSPDYLGPAGCDNVNADAGTIKTEKQKIISSKIFDLLDSYNNDCGAAIKTSLGFPSESDFTFRFLLANGSRIEPKKECAKISNQTNVYAEEFPVQYLNESLSLHVGKMSVKVW